jgi:transposase
VAEHSTETTIGMDLGDKFCQLFVLDNVSREGLAESRVPQTAAALEGYFANRAPARVVMEVGTHSGWISRKLTELGHEVLVADPRRVRALAGGDDKDDPLDAEFLARIGCTDVKLLKPIHHRTESTQGALALIRARDKLVQARTKLINCVRGLVKTAGARLPTCSSERFHKLEEQVPTTLAEALQPLMVAIKTITQQVRRYDGLIEQRATSDYPQTERLQQVAGIGPVTALAYVLVIEDPARFAKSRTVGSYLGLCPRRWQSGDSDPELKISKRGDALLRRLLVNGAHYILGPFGPDSDLRRWGLAYAGGGKNARKRAVVAVARKLAVLLHSLWTTGQTYEPLRNIQRQQTQPGQAVQG